MSCAGQRRVAGELALLDLVEREGLARGGDVVLDERRLARLLVGRDDEALDDGGVGLAAERGRRRRAPRRRPAALVRPVSAVRGGKARRRPARPGSAASCRRHARVHVGVARALDDAGRRGAGVGAAEPRAEREQQEERRGEPRQVRPARDRRCAEPNGVSASWPATRRGPRCRSPRPARPARSPSARTSSRSRQREDVERGVVAEDRVGRAERHVLPPRQQRQPFARRVARPSRKAPTRRAEQGERPQLIARRQRDGEAFARREGHAALRPALPGRRGGCSAEPAARREDGGADQRVRR